MSWFQRVANAVVGVIKDPLLKAIAEAILADLEPHLVTALTAHLAAQGEAASEAPAA